MLKDLIESNPGISYAEARALLIADAKPIETDVTASIAATRSQLKSRLADLDHQYHNEEHCEEVADRTKEFVDNLSDPTILTDREKELLVEAALRHDDAHAGQNYRQLVPNIEGAGMSNEEWSALLAIDDMKDKLGRADIEFIENHILATTFGQGTALIEKTFPDSSELQEKLKRKYTPSKPSEKLLALADVGAFRNGWDKWLKTSLNLTKETGNIPENIDIWIKNNEAFTKLYLKPLLESIKNIFKPEFYAKLEQELQIIIDGLESLKHTDNAQRAEYSKHLESLKK